MTANERRRRIMYYLDDRRRATGPELAAHFGVSLGTIMVDIEILTCEYPITTRKGRYGGIFVPETWHYDRRYLTDRQEELLRKICAGLEGDDRETMEGILTAFSWK